MIALLVSLLALIAGGVWFCAFKLEHLETRLARLEALARERAQ